MKIFDDEENGRIHVDDYIFEGFIDDVPCPKCGQFRIYYDDFDAFFCPKCNEWLESKCSDPTCDKCIKRPERPLPNLSK